MGTFLRPEVHLKIKQNILDALGFSERFIVLVTDFVCPTSFRSTERQTAASLCYNWTSLSTALDIVKPDVVLTTPVLNEGPSPDRSCHPAVSRGCNAQWRRLESCMEQV